MTGPEGEVRMADPAVCVERGKGLPSMASPHPRLEDQAGERPSAVATLLPCGILAVEGNVWWCGKEGAMGTGM